MTFIFDGGKVLRCKACGFRMYLGPWDLTDGWWLFSPVCFRPAGLHQHRPCLPCGGEMVETHVGRADGWVEIEAVAT